MPKLLYYGLGTIVWALYSTNYKVPFTLWYLASKTTFREVGNLFGYHRATINRIFHETLELICQSLKNIIQWPTSFESIDFRSMVGIPGVVGAIDGFDVKVLVPEKEQTS